MKLSYAIILIALLTGQSASLAFASTSVNGICQFDKSTMIKQKLKKAQECINNGNYSGAKNYLNGVLKLDPNNAKAKELLAICNNGGKPVSSPRDNSSSSNSNNDTQTGTIYKSTPYLNVSKTEMFFASDGGYESISISSNNTWKIKLNTNSWGHLKQDGNTLTLTVDANYTGNQRTDYFVLSAGGVEKRINITQSQAYAKNGVPMFGTTRAYIDNAPALNYLTTNINRWGKCRLGAISEGGIGIAIYGGNGYATTGNLNSYLVTKIKELNNQKEIFKSFAVTKSGFYCVVYGRNGWYGYVPEKMKNVLSQYNKNSENIYCVSIAENGDFVVISDKHIEASNTTDLSNLKKATEKYGHVKYACVTNRGLIVVCENGIFYSNIPTNLEVKLKSINFRPDKVVFTDSGTYLITNESESYGYNM